MEDDAERIVRILSLYTEDAVWEGVGSVPPGTGTSSKLAGIL